MKHPRRLLIPLALALTAALMLALPAVLKRDSRVPGLEGTERILLRIWVTGSPGGAQSWLTGQLKVWEKQHPGNLTYLRAVSPDALAAPDAVLPDIVLYLPGDIARPQELFAPLSGSLTAREELLRAGRWKGTSYGLPLCWGAWVMAIDSALEPGSAATPAPTTLLGRPAATAVPDATPPGYPSAAAEADCPLQSPGGAALLSMLCILRDDERPPLPENFAQLTAAEVYSAFQSHGCATAMLTTGQATAFTALTSAGKGFAFRIMVPGEIVTDQVWMASLTPDAPPQAAALLAFLTSAEAQQVLAAQGLHTVRDDLTLYAAGFSAEVEQAARYALSAVNAYLPLQEVQSAAWQALQGTLGFSEALLPLL
ncbi:MAG: hypothetical protein ACI4MG_00275 [Aristaeellaceae bacterium]